MAGRDSGGDEVGVAVSIADSGLSAELTIGNGRRRNALRRADWVAIATAARALADDERLRFVVLRGTGGTFSSGSQMGEWLDVEPAEVDATFGLMEAAFEAVQRIEVPTLAVLEGVAAGAGCELALSCDLRLMASSARLGMPILRLGIHPSPSFALRLAVLAGTARAREMLFTGRLIAAVDAERYGLVTEVAAEADLPSRLAELTEVITGQPRAGLVTAKAATGLELDRLRADHRTPAWRFTDAEEFQARVRAFLDGGRQGRQG